MACPCQSAENRRKTQAEVFQAALRTALERFRDLPASFAIARNGGWETTFRGLLLHELETSFKCVGFSERVTKPEPSRERADIVLTCTECGGNVLVVEVKHNYTGQSRSVIETEHRKARNQLKDCDSCSGYYVHLFVDLISANRQIESAHSSCTHYKRFGTNERHTANDISEFLNLPYSKDMSVILGDGLENKAEVFALHSAV